MEQTKKMNVIEYLEQQNLTAERDYPTREEYEARYDRYLSEVFAEGEQYVACRYEDKTYEEALIEVLCAEGVCEATDELPEGGFPGDSEDEEEFDLESEEAQKARIMAYLACEGKRAGHDYPTQAEYDAIAHAEHDGQYVYPEFLDEFGPIGAEFQSCSNQEMDYNEALIEIFKLGDEYIEKQGHTIVDALIRKGWYPGSDSLPNRWQYTNLGDEDLGCKWPGYEGARDMSLNHMSAILYCEDVEAILQEPDDVVNWSIVEDCEGRH